MRKDDLFRTYQFIEIIKLLVNNPRRYYIPDNLFEKGFEKKGVISKNWWQQKIRNQFIDSGIILELSSKPIDKDKRKFFFEFNKDVFLNYAFDSFLSYYVTLCKNMRDKIKKLKERNEILYKKYNKKYKWHEDLEKPEYVREGVAYGMLKIKDGFYYDENKKKIMLKDEIYKTIKDVLIISGLDYLKHYLNFESTPTQVYTVKNFRKYKYKIKYGKKYREGIGFNVNKDEESIRADFKNIVEAIDFIFKQLDKSIPSIEVIKSDGSFYQYYILTLNKILMGELKIRTKNYKKLTLKKLNIEISKLWAENLQNYLDKKPLIIEVKEGIPNMSNICLLNERLK